MTQKQLAKAAGVSEGTIRNLETDTYSRPQVGVLAAVGRVLDVDVEMLGVDRAEVVRNALLSSEVRTALDVLGGWLMRMSDEEREAALGVLYQWMLTGLHNAE